MVPIHDRAGFSFEQQNQMTNWDVTEEATSSDRLQ